MTDPEEALVRDARAGNRAAFEELVRRTSRLIFARLYLETGDTHRAEDLLQETLLTAFRSMGDLTDPRAFRPWLLKIAQNVAIDAARHDLRKKRAVPAATQAAALNDLPANAPGPEEQAEQEELRRQLLAVLRSLPEEYRLPLTLRYLGGADYETIRIQLGITNGSLRGLLHRGLKLLRSRLPNDFRPASD
ncbi:MAG: sigma-70 family RNA polymerase sigma factor [Planctomycetes bacterium]|nr:sigma-70 family RNA polymerase sigma factor [Planctomycetota bacterium]